MNYTVELTNFVGPLDLLLKLIESQQLDITEISLGEVTQDYIRLMKQNPLESEEMMWFVAIATRLIHIKSRLLLPEPEHMQADEASDTDLSGQLELYRIYRDISLEWAERTSQVSHGRPVEAILDLERDHAAIHQSQLLQALRRCYQRQLKQPPASHTIQIRHLPLKQAEQSLLAQLRLQPTVDVYAFIRAGATKRVRLAKLLAVLELLKSRSIALTGSHMIMTVQAAT